MTENEKDICRIVSLVAAIVMLVGGSLTTFMAIATLFGADYAQLFAGLLMMFGGLKTYGSTP